VLLDVFLQFAGDDQVLLDVFLQIAGDDQVLLDVFLQIAGDDQVLLDVFLQFAGDDQVLLDVFLQIAGDDQVLLDVFLQFAGDNRGFPLARVCNPCHGVRFLLFHARIANPRERWREGVSPFRSLRYAPPTERRHLPPSPAGTTLY
jgi:hypothetical protein